MIRVYLSPRPSDNTGQNTNTAHSGIYLYRIIRDILGSDVNVTVDLAVLIGAVAITRLSSPNERERKCDACAVTCVYSCICRSV